MTNAPTTTQRDPHGLGWGDLVWSHFSRPRHGDLEERLDAAASAGFIGVGLYLGEVRRVLADGWTLDRLRGELDERGLALADVEALRGWADPDGSSARAACADDEALIARIADEVGVHNVQVIGPHPGDRDVAIDSLGRLASRLDALGLVASVEWLPFTNIDTIAEARAMIEATEATNLGLCADIWHHRRGGNDEAALAALPGELVTSIQLNDGGPEQIGDDYKVDCLANRIVPGAGTFDCVGFLRTLLATGTDAPLALEVCSTEMWRVPAAEAATRAADAARDVLAALEREGTPDEQQTCA